uniref:Immunoglobulin domain-containing protein n=1 Tax=Cyprinus carpio TaxID=7962 RepID=A0A8C1N1C9_CYPCA
MVHLFILLCLWHLFGVFGVDADGMKSVSVLEGDSVTLDSGVTEMMNDEVILWRFGTENTLIVEMKIMDGSINVFDDVLDGRFRDRLKLDHQTGSLIITNITPEHTGLYKLQTKTVRQRFSLNVQAPLPLPNSSSSSSSKCEHLNITELCQTYAEVHRCCDSTETVIRLVVAALMGVAAAAAVVLLVNDVRSSRG